jgi:protein subunit release factor A
MELNELDLQIHTFRSGVNQPVTVWIVHIPTGITSEKYTNLSQLRAREDALHELHLRLENVAVD